MCEHRLDRVGSLAIIGLEEVRVDVEGDCRIFMSKATTDHNHIDAIRDERGSMRVAQRMKTHAGQTEADARVLPASREAIRRGR